MVAFIYTLVSALVCHDNKNLANRWETIFCLNILAKKLNFEILRIFWFTQENLNWKLILNHFNRFYKKFVILYRENISIFFSIFFYFMGHPLTPLRTPLIWVQIQQSEQFTRFLKLICEKLLSEHAFLPPTKNHYRQILGNPNEFTLLKLSLAAYGWERRRKGERQKVILKISMKHFICSFSLQTRKNVIKTFWIS